MRRHWKLSVAVACSVAAAATVAALLRHEPEPRYQGQPLSHWLKAYDGPTESERAEGRAAIRHIGSNAIPSLLRFITYTPPRWKNPSLAAFRKLQGLPLGWLLIPRALVTDEGELLAACAEDAFRLLGPQSVSATPELTRLAFDSTHRASSDRAIRIFIVMRPVPKDALGDILSTAPLDRRIQTLQYLAVLRSGDMVRELLPALIECLHDPNEYVARTAAGVILELKFTQPKTTLGVLVDGTKHPSPSVRVDVLKCIGTFEHGAASAVPRLLSFLNDPDARVRIEATNTFQIIAPEVLTNGISAY